MAMSGSRSRRRCSAARDKDQFEEAHVKVFDPQGKLIKEIGKGTFTRT